jgi:hypothetical protein
MSVPGREAAGYRVALDSLIAAKQAASLPRVASVSLPPSLRV